jgi:hypothetical protein
MATMNFSVPPDAKKAFDHAFAGENKSAVLTDLMRQAIEERRRRRRRARAIQKLLRLRKEARALSDETIRPARIKGRP